MRYNELKFEIASEHAQTACDIAAMLDVGGMYLEDYSDMLDCELIQQMDLIEQELLDKDRTKAVLHVYIAEHYNAAEAAAYMGERLSACNIPYVISYDSIDENDFRDCWKKYYKPLHIGKITIVPEWEEYTASEGEIILRIDPGMAFGTGNHETTSLCVSTLQDYVNENTSVLDVGCGSGILSIASLLLGSPDVFAVDIDPNAAKTALKNAALNCYPGKFESVAGNILSGEVCPGRKYEVIVANIVADIIIKFTPAALDLLTENGIFISSGIITERGEEVKEVIRANGFEIVAEYEKNGWNCFVARKLS